MTTILKRTFNSLLITMLFSVHAIGQVSVAPLSCYPQFSSVSEMNAAAATSMGNLPFATWKGAYDYAIGNGINNIDFVAGTYLPGGVSGLSSEWGDASGGFNILAGMTVSGNGAVIDNSANNNSLAFATITGDNATLDGFTFVQFTGNNTGAVGVSFGLTGWTISNCNFDHNDWAGDGLVVNQGAGSSGTITGCNFYGHVQSTGSAMTVNGAGGQLDILNTVYSCNSRIVAGGAVRILGSANVDFDGCTFDGNLTNSASGGAISIEENSTVSFTNTIFTCNTAIVNVQDDGGAMHIIGGSDVTITDCNFTGNEAQDKGGAIHVSGASASLVTLNITGTEFHNNEAQTATSFGGAVYINDFIANFSGNYFSGNQSVGGNTNGGGGAIYISAGNSTSTLTFNNNTLTGNSSGNGNGNAIRTEINFEGSDNNISGDIYTACTSPGPGFFNFAGDDFDGGLASQWTASPGTTLSNSGGDYMFIDHSTQGSVYYDASSDPLNTSCPYNTVFNSNSEKITWTFTISNATGLDGFAPSVDGMAFVLGASDSDFFANTTNGYAVFFDRLNNTDIELTYFTGGLSAANATAFCSNTNGISSGNSSASVRVTYTAPSSWTLEYDWSNGSSGDLDVDPRGDNGSCMGPAEVSVTGSNDTYTGADLKYTGFAMSGSNGTRIDYYHTRLGSGCVNGPGWSNSPAIATCNTCLESTFPSDDCMDQGSIAGTVFDDSGSDDGINDGEGMAGVVVTLYYGDGTPTGFSLTTGADGTFFFGGLENGAAYYVVYTPPAGYNLTLNNAVGSNTMNDSDVTSLLQSNPITINTVANDVDANDETTNHAHYTSLGAGFTTTVLPVKYSSISVSNMDCNALLSWKTESEVNHSHFEIERMINENEFEMIGEVSKNEDFYRGQSYEFVDENPSLIFKNYYRLKQVDLDGAWSYSQVYLLMLDDCNSKKNIVKISPNPFESYVNVVLDLDQVKEEVTIEIYNILGNIVRTENISEQDGNLATLQINDLISGIYLMKIKSGKNLIDSRKIIKQ